ncbi:MAG TPA: hypothetical protein VHQ64_20725 [Pyrinomonadaceae bacterium]|nr:hypothetical protein [Pyrinomonadaceae bacterium]
MKRIGGVLTVVLGLFVVANALPPDQPFMEAARTDLQRARGELQLATRDKGGHRGKAVNLVSQAIGQVTAGIDYAKRHNHAAPDQPHMQAALDALRSAQTNLEKATADKGGHRAKAMDLVKQAIDEVKLGIEAGR